MEPRPSLYENPLFRRAAGRTLRPGGLEATREALGFLAWPAGALVAEVGCGAGATLGLLKEMGFTPRGFELSPDLAREAAAATGCRVDLADAAALPLTDASVDGLVSECVLSLLDRPEDALAEFHRVLKPGGGLLLADIVLRREPTAGPRPEAGSRRSCLEGALTADENERRLEARGFTVCRTLDRTEALTALAVQLVWEGCGLSELASWLGFSCDGSARRDYGYCQWIAAKAG